MFNKDVQRMRTFRDWREEDIKSIQAPALIVIGDQDVVRPEHAVEMYRLFAPWPFGNIGWPAWQLYGRGHVS